VERYEREGLIGFIAGTHSRMTARMSVSVGAAPSAPLSGRARRPSITS
jgi:hypothetical protein